MTKQMFFVYAFLSVILLIFYLDLAGSLIIITYALTEVFGILNIPLEGAIILLIINIIILLLVLEKIQQNVSRIDWEPFKSNNLTYEITVPKKGYNPTINVIFIATYDIMGQIHERKVAIVKNQIYKQKITQILDDKLVKNSMKAILYKKPRSDSTEVIYRNKFSITNVLLVAVLLPIHVGLIAGSLMLYAKTKIPAVITLTQILDLVKQGSVGYIYGLSVLVLGLYIIYVLWGIKKSGLRGYRSYPMLYDVSRGLEEDFLASLYRMSDVCPNCGEIIEVREKYCSSCGEQIPKKKFYHVYDDPKTEEEDSDLLLMQQDEFN